MKLKILLKILKGILWFFKPKHTLKSVTEELKDGLKNGTITLNSKIDPEVFELFKTKEKVNVAIHTEELTQNQKKELLIYGIEVKSLIPTGLLDEEQIRELAENSWIRHINLAE